MQLSIVDAVSRPSGAVNEDRWGAGDGAVWILDGATGIAEQRVLPGPSDALWLVERVDAGLREHATRPGAPSDVLRPIVSQMQDAFTVAALRPDAPPVDMPGTALAMLRLHAGALELSSLGDCRIVRGDDNGGVRCFGTSKVTALDDLLVAEVVRLQSEGTPHHQIWRRVLPMTRRHRALRNLPEGYWMLDLTDRGLDHIEVETVEARRGATFLLLTDGFYRLVDVYGRHSYATLFAAAQDRGLKPLYEELRAIEVADADCRRYPRLKPCDDATAVLVRVE
jgi:serine/threonine protein phosphatase PrpC